MPITRVEVDEYQCALCSYKWISRVNGKDGPIPNRCAKCKRTQWEKGEVDKHERNYMNALRKKFGYYNSSNGIYQGGWRIEENIQRYLQRRPSVEEMKLLLEPICYIHPKDSEVFRKTKMLYDERYKSYLLKKTGWSEHELIKNKRMFENYAIIDAGKDVTKARDYEHQLSRQLLRDLMTERGITYDEKEAKKTTLYRRHGQYAPVMIRLVREMCDALKQDLPELSNEGIKSKIIDDFSEQLKYVVKSPEGLIQDCFPDWLKE